MSLFKRPLWAAKEPEADAAEPKDLFSHSESFKDVVAESQRRKREKAERKAAKAERRSSSKRKSDEVKLELSPGPSKRRRINSNDAEKLLSGVGITAGAERDNESSDEGEDDEAPKSARKSPRKKRDLSGDWEASVQAKAAPKTDVIELGDSSEDEVKSATAPVRRERKAPSPSPILDEDSDPDFAALARQARARQSKLARSILTDLPLHASANHLPTPPPPLEPDPEVQLLITSQIADTKPLRVIRRLSQRLQEVRHAWCGKQGFTPAQIQEIFFIHNMRRVYDATTCRSLGLDVNEEGAVFLKGSEGMEGADKVHLEAVNAEIFEELKRLTAREEAAKRGEEEPEAVGIGEQEAEQQEAKGDALIRVILKAKATGDWKLKVKPTTTFAKMANAFRKQFGIGPDKAIYLEFDGDRLDPDAMMSASEVADDDCIEVHIS
ncbi:hypothetical protein B0A48_05845 [Cryoendolithus antarcticus]|uniref:Rad60/SUMO-like domain-containing protein n=1 Tax=Cryoendolithus antarcticus TaxID=1507870 RepID=A0A1V8TC53_9PEZI|nr:hypothetical protein B0A48_05845 [Cryoendolithus antarcticus]